VLPLKKTVKGKWMRSNRIPMTALAAIACVGLCLAAPGGETYKARLSAVPADARTRPQLAGLGSATAILAGSKLTVTGSFDGLVSPATMAQLHSAVAAGVRGPAIADLTISKATSGMISGAVDLTPQQIENLHKGGLYVEIHSEKAPDGVLWGWLLR
jgi:CHRD domain